MKEIEKKNDAAACAAATLPGTSPSLPSRAEALPGESVARVSSIKPNDPCAERESDKAVHVDEEEVFLSSSMDNPIEPPQNSTGHPVVPHQKNPSTSLPVYNTTKLQFRLTNGELLR